MIYIFYVLMFAKFLNVNRVIFKIVASYLITDHPWIQNAKKAPNVNLGETVKARLKQFSMMNKLKKRALQVIFFGSLYLYINFISFARKKSDPYHCLPKYCHAMFFPCIKFFNRCVNHR